MAFLALSSFAACVILGGLYVFLAQYVITLDPREPPLISPKIPIIGHAIGLLRNGVGYWVTVFEKCKQPIFTVGILKKKFYIVTSLDIYRSVQRNSRTVSFTPFVTMTAEKLSGLQPDHVKLFHPHNSRTGLAADTITGVEATLRQTNVDDLTVVALETITNCFNALPLNSPQKLHALVRHIVSIASTRAIYGPEDPFRDESVENAFWTFEETATVLLNGFLPSLKAKRSVAARDTVARAFTKYYENNGQEGASDLAKEKWGAPKSYGLNTEEIAKIEVPFLIGVLNNSVATTFWLLACILTNPELLVKLRKELEPTITRGESNDSIKRVKHTIHLDRIKTHCPLLLSTFHETLRTRTSFSTCRFVTEDTFAADPSHPEHPPYLLRAGSLLMIPADIAHNAENYWGPTAHEHNPERFTLPENKKTHPLAFTSFGGAPFICPGRQFATGEVLAITALIISRFDVLSKEGDAKLTMPEQKLSQFGAVPPPNGDVELIFREREGFSGEWNISRGKQGLAWNLESG